MLLPAIQKRVEVSRTLAGSGLCPFGPWGRHKNMLIKAHLELVDLLRQPFQPLFKSQLNGLENRP